MSAAPAPAPAPRREPDRPPPSRDTTPKRPAAPKLRIAPTTPPLVAGSPGRPLPARVAEPVEQSLDVDLSPVRVHDDARANEAAAARRVRAFTHGSDVYLAKGEQPTDVALMAHELAHVVQQRARPAVQLFTTAPAPDALEREAQAASAAVVRGEPATVAGSTETRVQGQKKEPSLLEQIAQGIEDIENWAEDKFWGLVEKLAPDLVPILRQGVFEWLKEKITSAVQSVFDSLMKPVRAVTDFIGTLSEHFTNLVAWMREAAGKIAKGDCSAIAEAAEKIQEVVKGLASPVIDKVKELAGKVGDFFKGIWERFGAPVWEWLKKVGGAAWDKIKEFAEKVWDWTKPVRDAAARAWKWVKNKLGIGEGPEGQNGLLQWVQEKAGKAWDWLKEKLEPIKKPLMVVAGILVMLSPAGPIIAIGAAVGGLIYGARWLAQKLRARGSVIRERGVLQGVIIPGIMSAVNAVSSALTKAANFLVEKLNGVSAGLGQAVAGLAGSIFSFAVSIVRWVADKFKALASWATDKVSALADWVKSGLERLRTFLQPVLDVIRAIGDVIADIFNIVKLIFTKAWNLIPACIRDPIVDFIRDQILKRIPIFSTLLEIPDIWAKVKNTALTIIKQIFTDGDLIGAAITFFKAVLEIVNIPLELVTGIFTKAAAAIDNIVKNPLGFLRSVLGAIWQGFKQFFGNILRHLLAGVLDWLTGQLKDAAIAVPTEWSFVGILKMILSILGITLEKIWKILGKKIGDPIVEKLKKAVKFLTGAWEWVSALITEGPAGMWKKLQEQIGQLKEMLIDAVVGWISETVIVQAAARILTALNPAGAIINAIILAYKAIQTAAQYARQILEIANRVLDVAGELASGVVTTAANVVEWALGKALPIAIGFLANYLGLGGIGKRIAEMVKKIQDAVEKGIEKVVDWAINAGRAILDALGLGKKGDEEEDDPRSKAGTLLAQRLGSDHTEKQLEDEVAKIREELAPAGLKSLQVGPKKDNEERDITASASDGIVVATALRPAEGKFVVLTVRLEVGPDPLQYVGGGVARFSPVELREVELREGADVAVAVGRRIPAALISPAQTQARSGGYLLQPSPGQTHLELHTFNTKDPRAMSNVSHAEEQFIAWFESHGQRELRRKTTKISLQLTVSPCARCVSSLVTLLSASVGADDKTLRQLVSEGKLEANLHYDKPFRGQGRTTPADITSLRNGGWNVYGDTPVGDTDGEKIEPVDVKAKPVLRRRKPTPV